MRKARAGRYKSRGCQWPVSQVLRDYLQSERETLQLIASDLTANVRLLIAERFPKQDLRRVVNEITHMCKKIARLGFSETPVD